MARQHGVVVGRADESAEDVRPVERLDDAEQRWLAAEEELEAVEANLLEAEKS